LVVANDAIDTITKTSSAVALLKKLNAYQDVEKVIDSHKMRTGKGKARNRRYVQRRGPLVIYGAKDSIVKAFRNISGVEVVNVEHLNLLQLAPGGHLGRFIIWTMDAFKRLDTLYGSYSKASDKKGFSLPRSLLSNSDISRIINSDEVQSHLRPERKHPRFLPRKKNPLKNLGALIKLNPFAKTQRRKSVLAQLARKKKKDALLEEKRKGVPAKKVPLAGKLKKFAASKKERKPYVAFPPDTPL